MLEGDRDLSILCSDLLCLFLAASFVLMAAVHPVNIVCSSCIAKSLESSPALRLRRLRLEAADMATLCSTGALLGSVLCAIPPPSATETSQFQEIGR